MLVVTALVWYLAPAVAAQSARELIENADELCRLGRYDEARDPLEQALRTARGDDLAEARFRLAGIERDADAAVALYQRIIDDDPGGDWAKRSLLELAKVQYALGNYNAAYNLLSDGDVCNVSDEGCLFRGLSAIMLERYNDARAPLERIHRGRLRTWAYISLAEVDKGLKREREACDRYESLASAMISPTAIYRYAECLEDRGDDTAAKDEYRAIIRSFRDTPEAVLAAEKLQRIDQPRDKPVLSQERGGVTPSGEEHGGVEVLEKGFTLQFGSFRDRGNAIKLAAKIKRVFPGVRIDSELVKFREYHRVRYGYFHTREEARERGEEITKQINQDYTIMTLP